jgi:hypothetical protein
MTHPAKRCRQQHGAAAVEFAFVFPILFLLLYGVIVYSYIFVLQESVTYAAQVGAESGVRVDPDRGVTPDYEAVVRAHSLQTVQQALAWLPEPQRQRLEGNISIQLGGEGDCTAGLICVTVSLPLLEPTPIFPVLDLFIVGRVPRLPDAIRARAVALI